MLDQFDRLRRRNAFLEQYKRQRMFENGLEEFDDARYHYSQTNLSFVLIISSRATCEELLKEYKACESADYISYVSSLFRCAVRYSRVMFQGSTEAEAVT